MEVGGEELTELSRVMVVSRTVVLGPVVVVGAGGGASGAGGVILAGPNLSLTFNLGDPSILIGASILGDLLRFLEVSS